MRRGISRDLAVAAVTFAITTPFTGWWWGLLLAAIVAAYLRLVESPAGKSAGGVASFAGVGSVSRRWQAVLERWRLSDAKLLLFVLFLFIALPFILNRYHLEVLTLAMIYVTLSVSLNFIVGLCGLLALGFIAFYAVGAYTYAYLNTQLAIGFFACVPIGFLTGLTAGGLVGLPVLRLRGDYLAIVTLGFGEIVRIVLNNWDEVTRGPNGIMGIARPELLGLKLGTPAGYYFLALALAILVIISQARLSSSKIGRAWEAIREDELAAAQIGIPVFKMKMLAMMLGGAWAGAAGALFAARMTHVSPESFTFLESVLVLCMVVLGGMGSISGVTVGALALIIVPELLRGVANFRMLAFGLVLVLMMQFRGAGLIPSKRLKMSRTG